MNNPLVFFVGAAVVAVAVLAGMTFDRWRDWPTQFRTTLGEPETVADDAVVALEPDMNDPEPDADAAEDVPADDTLSGDVAEAPVEEPAAVPETEEIEPARPDEPAPEVVAEAPASAPDEEIREPERLAAVDPKAPDPAVPSESEAPETDAEAPPRPSFDVVRLEEDGSLIAVGRAAPDATVVLLLDGEVIATSQANEIGEWLILPDDPLPPGNHVLMVEARDPSGSAANSSEVVALAVPQRTVAALGEPSPPPAADVTEAPEPVGEDEPAASEPAQAPSSEADEEQLAFAPQPEPQEEPEPEPQAALEPEPQAAPEPGPPAESQPGEQMPERLSVPLALETVDYNDEGDIVFSGRADPGRGVRIYVDNRFVGETTADLDGRWVFAGREQIAPGRHALRADLLGVAGNVLGRIELPFVRADSREIAALVEARREAAGPREAVPAPDVETLATVEAPESAEPVSEPEPEAEAPAVAEAVAPEPEPEAPVVAEPVAPEPEPEAPVVAEPVAPEPEPEAPVVAEAVAPEPEPEAPVVAEAVEPEPEPEAVVVAEPVAPEPEPEAPAVAEAVAPEPEAPAVAEAVEPEPEPEAPAVAEPVAPEPEPEAPAVAEPDQASEAPKVAAVEEQAEPEPEPEIVPSGPGHVVIQPGNNLWRISRVIYGRGVEYTVIYQANRDQIRDPDLIYPGQIFATPGVHPPKEIDPAWRQPLTPEDPARRDAGE